MQNQLVDILLPIAMFALMSGMGLTLTLWDFRRIADAPAATILGTLLQLVAMPIAGVLLALAFELPPLLAVGLVIMAGCPGGMFSNVFIHLAQANTVLSITLTATATMITLMTLPLWVRLISTLLGEAGTGLDVPVLETALSLAGLTVLPVILGMWVRQRWPEAVRFEKNLTRFGGLAIAAVFTQDALQRPELPVEEFTQTLLPGLCLSLVAFSLGFGASAVMRLPFRDSTTLTVELVLKNGLLGLVIARGALDFEATLPIIAYGTIQMPVSLAILSAWWFFGRKRARAQEDQGPDQVPA